MFNPDKILLSDMLQKVGKGAVQLPDFQRGWVWSDEHIRSLLASVSLSYPIGAVMMLQTGNDDVKFKLRPLEGATPPDGAKAGELLLDGQQRMTSLFQSLASSKVVETRDARDKPVKRWYYVDMRRAVDPNVDREEVFISVPEDRRVRNFRGEVLDGQDYSTPELERGADMFPVRLLLDHSSQMPWMMAYLAQGAEQMAKWQAFYQAIIQPFMTYQVPVITMDRATPKEAVCQVFEKVNTGGVSLTVFELLTATFAADDFQLREAWYGDEKASTEGISQRLRKRRVLGTVENTDFLQTVTLLATRARRQSQVTAGKTPQDAPPVSCKRKDILKLTLEEFEAHAPAAEQGFLKAAQFLYGQKMFTARDLPYRTQLVPLAATLAVLGEHGEDLAVQDRLAQWYWCGVFGELYASATETRFAKDFPELLGWLAGGEEPGTIREATFHAQRLDTLRTRNSAAYKGVYALLMRDGAQDFRTGQSATEVAYFDEKIDIHHIFPQDWCEKQGIERAVYDSVINKTPLTATTNRRISNKAPSLYLAGLQGDKITPERMDEILATHVVDVEAMRADDFSAFYGARKTALIQRIEAAMKKPVMVDA